LKENGERRRGEERIRRGGLGERRKRKSSVWFCRFCKRVGKKRKKEEGEK